MTEPSTLERFGGTYLRLRALLADASEAQWTMGVTPHPKEDTTERSKGLTADPVPTAVMDTRRLQVRASVIEAEHALTLADQTLRAAVHHLEAAFNKWQG